MDQQTQNKIDEYQRKTYRNLVIATVFLSLTLILQVVLLLRAA